MLHLEQYIPFAASNLKTAVIAVRANLGVTLVGLFLVFVAFVWTAIWLLSLTGVYVQMVPRNDKVCDSRLNGWVALLFLLSYYWTQQVIKNMIHVTVAGVVGTWWFNPDEASSMCSRSIYNSFLRSATTSFGSICLGSLLVSIIQVVHHLLLQARREGEDNILFCVLDCLVSILEKVAEFFNKWVSEQRRVRQKWQSCACTCCAHSFTYHVYLNVGVRVCWALRIHVP